MSKYQEFLDKGWCSFEYDPALARWVEHALPFAQEAIASEEHAQWLRHGGTWHAGVNALPNDANGNIGKSGNVGGEAVNFIREFLVEDSFQWDRAQISVCYPGYPKPSNDESAAALRYRIKRDAAHIDGLRREGPNRRRFLGEYHGFILGVPLAPYSEQASPFVVWEGSHRHAKRAFSKFYGEHSVESWGEMDVADVYKELRNQLFNHCKRITLPVQPGQAFVVHRLALHGMAAWHPQATAGPDGRMICYFRPEIGGPNDWLNRS